MTEVERLEALGEWMRRVGATRLVLADVTIELAPLPAPSRPMPPSQAKDEDDEGDAEAVALRRWNAFWSSVTHASGAPIPQFPGIEQARQVVGD